MRALRRRVHRPYFSPPSHRRYPMRALALASLALLVATPAFAQQWTAEEQEVIDTITMCWDAWVEASADETPAHWYDTCRPDENALMWWSDQGAPQGVNWHRRNWDTIREGNFEWADLRPVAVRIYGDVAIVYLYGYWSRDTAEGRVTSEHRRTEVFQRRDDGWTFIGGQGSRSGF